MKLYAGTSGFSYNQWRGHFYPEDLPASRFLFHYSGRLNAVEINNTFYRMPRPGLVESWASDVPSEFRFALKASRRITHFKRLKDAADETSYFLGMVAGMNDRLGTVLFQLPPNFSVDVDRLRAFLSQLPVGVPATFEFRHSSWFQPEVFDLLRESRTALCIADTGSDNDPPLLDTAPHMYFRLRRPAYSESDLKRWAEVIAKLSPDVAFVFFKHEDDAAGPRMAERFLQIVEAGHSDQEVV